jgi:hypothetical protein
MGFYGNLIMEQELSNHIDYKLESLFSELDNFNLFGINEAAVDEKKPNIFKRILAKIKEIFRTIKEKISNLIHRRKKDKETPVSVPASIPESINISTDVAEKSRKYTATFKKFTKYQFNKHIKDVYKDTYKKLEVSSLRMKDAFDGNDLKDINFYMGLLDYSIKENIFPNFEKDYKNNINELRKNIKYSDNLLASQIQKGGGADLYEKYEELFNNCSEFRKCMITYSQFRGKVIKDPSFINARFGELTITVPRRWNDDEIFLYKFYNDVYNYKIKYIDYDEKLDDHYKDIQSLIPEVEKKINETEKDTENSNYSTENCKKAVEELKIILNYIKSLLTYLDCAVDFIKDSEMKLNSFLTRMELLANKNS